MAAQFQPARSDQGSLNFKDLFFKYLRFLPLFILSVILALSVAFLYLRWSTSTYQSKGSLILSENKNQRPGSDKFEEIFVDDRSKNIQNEMEYLKSRPMMERVVEALNLNWKYYAKGKIKEQNVYKSAPFKIEAVQLRDSANFSMSVNFTSNNNFRVNNSKDVYTIGQTFHTPNGFFKLVRISIEEPNDQYRIEWYKRSDAAAQLLTGLSVAPKPTGSIIVLSMESDNAYLAADVLNGLMDEYQQSTIEDKNTTTRQTLKFIDGRLKVVNREYDSVSSLVVNFLKTHQLTDVESATATAYAKSGETEKEQITIKEQMRALQDIEIYVGSARAGGAKTPSSLGIPDPTLNRMVESYNELQMERKVLVEGGTPASNPRVELLDQQIEKSRTNILESVRTLQRSANQTLADAQRRNLSARYEIATLPSIMQDLVELRRQQENKLGILNFLNEKREESAISLAATISNIKVLEKAYPVLTPISPKAGSIKTMAILIGLIIPALFIFIMEMLDDKISTRADIEKSTTVTILGEVGHSAGNETLIVTPKSRSFVAEQFRIIRSNLQYVANNVKSPVYLVTSSFSGEGKSFISTNIGAVMALAGKRTIVLEFDIRKPKVLSGLGMSKRPGLTNYLLGKIGKEELPVPVEGYDNLFVLPCGPIPPNPAELLLDARLAELFVYLRANFDVIIMDTAPIGMVGDAMTLSQFADASIYIVRQGVTHKKQIDLIEEYFREGKLPKMNIILNDIKIRAGYGYYGYGRYGYGYGRSKGYGYGYYDDQDKDAPGMFERWFGWSLNGKKKSKKTQV